MMLCNMRKVTETLLKNCFYKKSAALNVMATDPVKAREKTKLHKKSSKRENT